ncbi:MAG: tRNA-dihydrouridine synthase, partial [Planctomycetota bacterium]
PPPPPPPPPPRAPGIESKPTKSTLAQTVETLFDRRGPSHAPTLPPGPIPEWEREREGPATPHFTLGGSGDIWQAPDIFRMLEQTGVHWVSVARGCIGNPWIFEQARALMRGDPAAARTSPTIHQQRDVLLEHFQISVELHGEHQAGRMMRKFGIKFSRHHPRGMDVKSQFIKTRDLADWQAVLDTFYTDDGPGAEYDQTIPDEAEYVECGLR